MTEADALCRAVVSNPDDDTPRLIFADWLEEQGQPERAAFIRAQIEAARAEPWSPAAREAEARAAQLLKHGQSEWRPDWANNAQVGYRRGFIERVAIEPHIFRQVATQLFEQCPVRTLAFTRPWTLEDAEFSTSLLPVFENPLLRHLTRLELVRVDLAPEEQYALSACPHLADLRELALSENPLSVDWLAEMLAGPAFPCLTALELADMANLGPRILSGLLKCRHRRFSKIDFSGIRFLFDELIVVFGHPAIKDVAELRFGWKLGPKYLGPVTHIEMAPVMPWENLRLLELAGQGIGSGGVEAIANNADRSKLRWLGLAANEIGSTGVDGLLESDLRLFYLDVRGNGLSKKQVARLRGRFPEAAVLS